MQALTTAIITHIAHTKSKLQIPCTDNMTDAINHAKSGGVFHIELPDVYNPGKNIWAWDPMQIVEVIPVTRDGGWPSHFICDWLMRHSAHENCKCYIGIDGIWYNPEHIQAHKKRLFPEVSKTSLTDAQRREILDAVIKQYADKK